MSFTTEQLKSLGFILQPDGNFTAPGAARIIHAKSTTTTKKKDHPLGLSHALPQQAPAKALDRGPQGQAGRQESPGRGHAPVRLTITRFSTRCLDADNLAGGCKPLIDAIRRAGLITDDDPKSVELVFAQHICRRGEERTEVEIVEVTT